MNDSEWAHRLADLFEQDVDYIVDVLELTAEDLINTFPDKVEAYIMQEFG